jgi:hypothetical protein
MLKIPLYDLIKAHKTCHKNYTIDSIMATLGEKFKLWAGSNFKDIVFEGTKCYVSRKMLSKNSDPEYYNREVKRLKARVRKVYNRSKYGQNHQTELKRLSTELLLLRRFSYVRFYEMKVEAGLSFTGMLNDAEEDENVCVRVRVRVCVYTREDSWYD